MKVIQKNKKALFDYEILENFKAGLMLTGPEVKSVRNGDVNLKGAYISTAEDAPVLKGCNISRYRYDSTESHEPMRDRKLLLKQREIDKITRALNEQGVTVVPIAIGLEGKFIKLEIATARGKKKHDKRNVIKERSQKRDMARIMKSK